MTKSVIYKENVKELITHMQENITYPFQVSGSTMWSRPDKGLQENLSASQMIKRIFRDVLFSFALVHNLLLWAS